MKLWINAIPRKDEKFSCVYGFSNGRRFKKLRTFSQIKTELAAAFKIEITDNDLNNTLLKARQTRGDSKLYYEF